MPDTANRNDTSGISGGSGASIAAHAALFDSVASRDAEKQTPKPLDASRQPVSRRASFAWFDTWLNSQQLDGAQALDLGCGRGEVAVQIAGLGAHVTGIDISPESLSRAKMLAEDHGVGGGVKLQQGNAEQLAFDDDSFDLAVSAGVMSFVDFDRSVAELARVVRHDGTAVILDTLGHNPIARMGRRRHLVTGQTTRFQVDNIITCNHLDRLRAHFGSVEVHAFDFLTVPMMFAENLLARIHPALAGLCAPVSAGLRALDSVILKWRPLRRYAFRVVIVLKWPRVHETG
jgi:ubiquinone/menaquinone biosynthesis C-methylase UbiE